jgi:hypothetical protein
MTYRLRYDVAGLAHYELVKAMKGSSGLAVSIEQVMQSMTSQLNTGMFTSAVDPFYLGTAYSGIDVVPHAFGYWLEASFVAELNHSLAQDYLSFANTQRNFIFGCNAWGASFVIGAGSSFPYCPQHQVANLVGSLNGGSPVSITFKLETLKQILLEILWPYCSRR